MTDRRSSSALVVAVGLILLHFSLRPVIISWSGSPDLLVGALLLAALQLRAGGAAALGLVLGALEGSMALTGMATLIISYTLAGYVGARARDLLFSDSRAFVPLFLLGGVWLIELITTAFSPSSLTLSFALLFAPLSALLTALICSASDRVLSWLLS